MTVIASIGVVVPFFVGVFAFLAHAWIVVGIAAAIFVINAVWANRRVHHFDCVACGHDARDHLLLGETAKVKDCLPRDRRDRPCRCQITDDSPLRPVSLYAHVERLVDRFDRGGGGVF